MQISDILSEKRILTDLCSSGKRQLLEDISERIAKEYKYDKSSIFEAMLERENLGSTGYGNGVAFPHARIPGLQKIITFFVRLDKAVDYEAIDDKPVDLLAVMISPENSGDDHLRTLSEFSRILKNAEICRLVRKAKNKHDIYLALQN